MHHKNLIFRQLFEKESSTYTYLLVDKTSKEGIIIDPVIETYERDLKLIKELDVNLKYILDTHIHADHVTSSSKLKASTGAEIVLGKSTGIKKADRLLDDGEEISFGSFSIKTFLTPGHTNGCTSYYLEGMVFTGDALLIRGCGRTDFQEGSNATLYSSVHEKLFTLDNETIVYPGHNYAGIPCSSIGEEKQHNPRLGNGKTLEEFSEIMDNLNLAHPKKIDVAVPANMKCGEV